jgi:hypothetical protein
MTAELGRPDPADQAVAERILATREYNGQRFQLGQYVAILHGQVVATAGDAEQAHEALRRLAPNRWDGLICLVAERQPEIIRRPA